MRPIPAVLSLLALIAGPVTAGTPAPPVEMANVPVGLLIDVNSGRTLYARAPDRRFLPASTTKVMTAYVAFEEIAKGRLAMTQPFTVKDETARLWNGRGTSLYLTGGTVIDADTLLHGIATVSANDASVVLAESYAADAARWCALMNTQAQQLGMTNSHFATPNGWPDQGATYVTARDLVTLGEALVTRHPQLYRRYFGQKRMTWNGVTQESHDPTVGVVRGADGIKTGHTSEAGYNFLGSAERDGRRLMMVVAGAHSEAERAAASRALLEWGFAEWQARPLFASNKTVAQARVQGGDARQVALVADRVVAAVLPKGETGPITLKVTYDGPLVAPIAKGAKVAELEIHAGEGPPSRLPLFAGAAVGKAGPIDRLINGVAGLFS
ncbi:D-alanyl-D-alanine carboxypeptidase family protein [Novosphingobium sp. G106]|uniref:D-alanyl-D-alanine carboxypeptidase family protein n=1 Tax=Novosphingobium sp. G106 TaxID=2849500 RepID=UPI0020C1F86D|nr:D-alanyl-D-alanine carboxypeptidase family protein [Novosphingobium sp. G106]